MQQKNGEHYVMKADSSLDSFLLWRNRPTGAQSASLLRFRYHTHNQTHTHTHTHSMGLLWARDRPDAETCAWQQTTFTRDRHPRPPPGGIRTRNLSKRVAVDTRLRPRDHGGRPSLDMGVMKSAGMKLVGHAAHIDKFCNLLENLKANGRFGDKHLE